MLEEIRSPISSLNPYVPTGMPPPIVLPMTSMSGSRPQARVAPPGPAQIVWVSSMIRIVPVSRVSPRSASW